MAGRLRHACRLRRPRLQTGRVSAGDEAHPAARAASTCALVLQQQYRHPTRLSRAVRAGGRHVARQARGRAARRIAGVTGVRVRAGIGALMVRLARAQRAPFALYIRLGLHRCHCDRGAASGPLGRVPARPSRIHPRQNRRQDPVVIAVSAYRHGGSPGGRDDDRPGARRARRDPRRGGGGRRKVRVCANTRPAWTALQHPPRRRPSPPRLMRSRSPSPPTLPPRSTGIRPT